MASVPAFMPELFRAFSAFFFPWVYVMAGLAIVKDWVVELAHK